MSEDDLPQPGHAADRPRRSDLVARHVREEILGGRLKAGDFVRPDWVASQLGVSATPAR